MPAEMSAVSVNGVNYVEAVFGYGEIPWWNSADMPATVYAGALSYDNVFAIAFPWQALQQQLAYPDGALSSQYGLRRSDTLAELGVHSGQYGLVQPSDLFEFAETFFKTHPEIPISAAISLKGGKILNLACKVGEIDVLGSGDIHKSYLQFMNSYDGSYAATIYKTYIQAVCMNTTRSGLAVASSKMQYKHTRHVKSRITADVSQVAELMAAQALTDQNMQTALETLAKRRLTKATYESILNDLFGDSDSTRAKNVKAAVTEIASVGTNATAFPDFRGTAYGAYTAITDYVDHSRNVRSTAGRAGMSDDQMRAEGALVGEWSSFKEKALERILVLTDGSEVVDTTYYSIPAAPPAPTAGLLDSVIDMTLGQ